MGDQSHNEDGKHTKTRDDQIDEKLREIGSKLGGGESAIPLLFTRGTSRVFFVVPSERHRELVTSRVLGMANDVHWRKHAGIGSAGKGGRPRRYPAVPSKASRRLLGLPAWPVTFSGGNERGVLPKKATVRVGTWNVAWAKRASKQGPLVAQVLATPDCHVLCVTEIGAADILPKGGNVIDAGTDWGYKIPKASPGRRKVLLWSKRPWTPVFDPLQAQLPGGRLVAGVTETPLGRVTVVGVCIPWRDAHVTTGMANRRLWEDHLAWLSGFKRLAYADSTWRTVVMGDFNQRIPRGKHAPLRVHDALRRSFGTLRCSTEGAFVTDPVPEDPAVSPDLWHTELQGPSDLTPGAPTRQAGAIDVVTLHPTVNAPLTGVPVQ